MPRRVSVLDQFQHRNIYGYSPGIYGVNDVWSAAGMTWSFGRGSGGASGYAERSGAYGRNSGWVVKSLTIDFNTLPDGIYTFGFTDGLVTSIWTPQTPEEYYGALGESVSSVSDRNLATTAAAFFQLSSSGERFVPYTNNDLDEYVQIIAVSTQGSAFGISGNLTPGGGANFAFGIVMDEANDYAVFFSFGPSVGFDGSIGFFAKAIYARDLEKGFSVARGDYDGYGSSYNLGGLLWDFSYGGSNNKAEFASHFDQGSYYEVGAGWSASPTPVALTWQESKTWTFSHGNLGN